MELGKLRTELFGSKLRNARLERTQIAWRC